MKFFFIFVVIAAVFLWLAPKLISGIGYLVSPPYVAVEKQTALAGKVTVYSANRGKYLYALEGRRETFDFDGFQNAALGPAILLGPYLEDGDFVQKKANSDTLRLTRHGQRSDWMLLP
ncbi:hypothetical protein QMK33_13440 [Hymenobacter sp. H14-R3]|uniref:hypothetical protein n=1 Tax=Hymenobacter sp. H14-R3 TaxID=3046308 RepID=UPI0024B8F2DD|nr:hypothetical protein [Hymenobacter sp. H14-R3]MDJ0366156.1 hypothetical protein [Hymenobacter sp. H14-R3]